MTLRMTSRMTARLTQLFTQLPTQPPASPRASGRAPHRAWLAGLASLCISAAALAQTATAAGEVTKLDKASGRITLKHGELKNLDMPPMTMVFRVRDPKMLDDVAVGDRVRFSAERIEGQFTVVALSKAPS